MKSQLKVFYVSSEVFPFAQASELGDVAGALPKYIKNMGHDIRVMMPNYKVINERKYVLRDVIRLQGMKIRMGDQVFHANGKSAFIPDSKVQIYFLDNEEYFERDGLYSDARSGNQFADNAQRFIFFAVGCLETLKLLYWQPDIIHCNDWQTAIIPGLLKTVYSEDSFFNNTKTLLSIHRPGQQGNFNASDIDKGGLSEFLGKFQGGDKNGEFNFLRIGLEYADMLNFSNENYIDLLEQNSDFNFGLQEQLRKRKNEIHGILNGIDDELWNPETDDFIPHNYTLRDYTDKEKNKKELLSQFEFESDAAIPLLSMLEPFADEEGMELVLDNIDSLLELNIRIIVVGEGGDKYQSRLNQIKKKYPQKFGLNLKGEQSLVHLVEAGSDLFLIPSRREPCGLHQLYSLSYGTIPIVNDAVALTKTVEEFNPDRQSGTGFIFDGTDPKAFLNSVRKGIQIYEDKEVWGKLVQNAMKKDFSWSLYAPKYVKLYQRLLSSKNHKK